MSIEFIRDEFLEGKKEELDDITKVLSQKPKKTDKNILFLKRFILALMGQYKVKKYLHEKHQEIEQLNKIIIEETKRLYDNKQKIQRIMPNAPDHIPYPSGLNVPIPKQIIPQNIPSPRIQIPTPQKIPQLKIPSPINETKKINIPEPIKINLQEKKEIPNPL